jgi:2-polyprenyl-3-methyl-5-hydroxy-6-metoxy-1,4-benzoquinol methylase
MSKVSAKEIKRIYSLSSVVDNYDRLRFSGIGGKYINYLELNSHISLIKKALHSRKGAKVLDIGAGRGRLTKHLVGLGYNVYCLDSSTRMVRQLAKILPKENIFLHSAFDKLRVPFKFDLVTSLRFFDHFDIEDQKKIILNFRNNLNDDGLFVFSALNKNSLEFLFSKIFYFGKVNFYYADEEYRKMFNQCDFSVIDFLPVFFIPRGIFLRFSFSSFLVWILIYLDLFLRIFFGRYSCLYVYLLKKK